MKILISQREFDSLKAMDLVPLECAVCGKEFRRQKVYVARIGRGTCDRTFDFCSNKCKGIKNISKVTVVCEGPDCGKQFEKTRREAEKSKHHYCCRSCAGRANNRNRYGKHSGIRRSKAEEFLSESIANDFPELTVETNVRSLLPSGYEVDILIRSCRLAIELNGPIHYFPIFGDEKLTKIQDADVKKQTELAALGYRLLVVDISRIMNSNYVAKFLSDYYPRIIKPIIESLSGKNGTPS